MSAALLRADALAIPLGDETVDLIVTSPPYFALRSYSDGGEHYDGQIGSEPTPTMFLEVLWAVTAECWRVLKPSGSLWVNLGDKYAGSGGHNNAGISDKSTLSGNGHKGGVGKSGPQKIKSTRRQAPDRYNQASDGIRRKSLMGLPWRYAIGCIDGMAAPVLPCNLEHEHWGTSLALLPSERCVPVLQRWVARAEVIWAKPNGLPESVTDRVRRSHETWFHLTKCERYYADMDKVREPHLRPANGATFGGTKAIGATAILNSTTGTNTYDQLNPLGKLPDSVWTIPTQPLIVPDELGVDHFAAFPTEWPRRIIQAWSPPGICTVCGEGRRSVVEKSVGNPNYSIDQRERTSVGGGPPSGGDVSRVITGTACGCPDTTAPTRPAVVLDPFGGTGTTAMVAHALDRYGVTMDLSADYLRLANWRIFDSDGTARVLARSEGRTYKPSPTQHPDQMELFT